MPGRTLAIGDIHGCSAALDGLLRLVDVAADDLVIPLGDYVDKGPDSRGVIDRLIDLADRCRLVPILGNHDEMLLRAVAGEGDWLEDWLEVGGAETLDSYGPGRDPSTIPAAHLAFLRSCLDSFETDRHLFAHASYEPDLPMDQQFENFLRWESLRDNVPGPHQSGKVAVLGHTSQKTGEVLDLGHLVCIDTYCAGGGWLTALDVESGKVWQVDRFGSPRT